MMKAARSMVHYVQILSKGSRFEGHDLFLLDLTTGVNQNRGSDPMDKVQLS